MRLFTRVRLVLIRPELFFTVVVLLIYSIYTAEASDLPSFPPTSSENSARRSFSKNIKSSAESCRTGDTVLASDFVELKVLNGVRFIFDAQSGEWREAYSGLMDGNWKKLPDGKLLSKEQAQKATSEIREQGRVSPFSIFTTRGTKHFGLDEAKKVWVELDKYSFPVGNGETMPYIKPK